MSSKRPRNSTWIDRASCREKSAYPSRKVALAYLVKLRRNIESQGKDRQPLSVYQCPACKWFHVGRDDVLKKRWCGGTSVDD